MSVLVSSCRPSNLGFERNRIFSNCLAAAWSPTMSRLRRLTGRPSPRRRKERRAKHARPAAHGKRRRLHDSPPQIAGRRRPHAKLVARNRAVLASLQTTCSTRAFRTVPPQELTDAAHKAARLTDTDAHIQTASRAYTRPFWYQSRVWDPDD